jgi:outer membrane protein OmpA-like peptidoglycan-associated protein/outer membrane protein W
MQLRSALLAATVLAMPFAASAQPVTGLYVGGGVGLNLTQKEDVKNLTVPTLPVGFGGGTGISLSGKLNGSAGFVGLVSVGWGFGNGLRAELEGNYRYNHISGFGSGNFGGSGGTNEQKYGPMVNVLYDFNGVSPWVVPYIGAGVGYQWVSEKFHASNSAAIPGTAIGPGGLAFATQSREAKFAYQAILGAAFPMSQIPGLALTTEYRFLGTVGNRTYSGTATATVGAASASAPASMQLGPTYNHAILVGLRYNFGVAPPPPPAPAAVPAPAPTRSYLVFFDWDKATLTDRARQIIKEAADNSTKVQYTRIEVNGYTDTSGTPKYNQGLSVRRAKAVQAELVKDGVPQNAITIQGFGDTHLLVPTGPGVREPQNRRVEIIIR